jgi:integrase
MDSWSNGHRLVAVHAYDNYVKMLGIKWEPPTYNPVKSLPFVPQEKEIDTLISGCSKKIATSLLLLKETGCRVGEAWMLRWTDLDEENSTINIRAEKGGNPRQLKISARLISMLLNCQKPTITYLAIQAYQLTMEI